MQKSPEIGWKMAVFDPQNAKSRTFFKMSSWNFVHVYTWQGTFTYIPFFENSKNFPICFENNIFVDYFSYNFQNFQNFEIPR